MYMNIHNSIQEKVGVYYCNDCDQKWYCVLTNPDMYKTCMKCNKSYFPKQWYHKIKKSN